tara:strand:- start:537 stop:815 length:279 start_codon:yes stop_codon:yes gene_type:complete
MNTLNEKVLRNSNEFRRLKPKRNQSIIWRLMVALIDLIYFKIRIAVIQIDKNKIWDWLETLMKKTSGSKQAQDKNEHIREDQIRNPNPILYI